MATRMQCVVLTESMKVQADALLKTNTLLFRHPFYTQLHRGGDSSGKTFLAVGRQARAFYLSRQYFDFLEVCADHDSLKKIKIVLALEGHVELVPPAGESTEVEIISGFVPYHRYLAYFQNSSFVIFPESEEADYRASGTLIDTLCAGSIFIAPDTGHFKEFSGCGILYAEGEFRGAVSRALNMEMEEVAKMRQNIARKIDEVERANQQTWSKLLT